MAEGTILRPVSFTTNGFTADDFTAHANLSVDLVKSYWGKLDRFMFIYIEGSATSNISSWETLLTMDSKFCPTQTNGAYTININGVLYMGNFNSSGVLNTAQPINSGQYIRFCTTCLTQN